MVETQGVVVHADERIAQIRTSRRSACGVCGSNDGCGVSSVVKAFDKAMVFRVANTLGVSAGEQVIVGVGEQVLLRSSLVAYVLPLVFLIVGAIIGSAFAPVAAKDAFSVAGAVIGVGLGFLGSKLWAPVIAANADFQPILLSRISNDNLIRMVERR